MTSYAPKIGPFSDVVLLKLYECLVTGETGYEDNPYAEPNEIADHFSYTVGTGYITVALTRLYNDGYAQIVEREFSEKRWIITDAGIDRVQQFEDEPTSHIAQYLAEGDEWLFGKSKRQENAKTKKQPSAGDWEPLPLEHENSSLQDTATKLEELAGAVEEDNGYAATASDERAYVLSALRNGAKALREQTVIYRMQFNAFIWQPLSQIASRFGNNAKGLAATALKESLRDTFKEILKGNFDKFKDWFN